MAIKSSYTSIFAAPIPVEFENFQDLESLIDELREVLETQDRSEYGFTARMYDNLLMIREQALRDFISSAELRLTYRNYKVNEDNDSHNIVSLRKKGEAA